MVSDGQTDLVDRQLTVKCESYSSFLEKFSVEQCFFNTYISYKHFETAGTLMGNSRSENDALTVNKITRTYLYAYKEVLHVRILSVETLHFD